MGKILIVDNYDSFTYNLVQYVKELSTDIIDVCYNDQIKIQDVEVYDTIIFSPGPGLPKDAGIMMDIIEHYKFSKKILGICLGHQAIGLSFGGALENLNKVFHGIKETIYVFDDLDPFYKGVKKQTAVGKYHSWIITKGSMSDEILVTAHDNKGNIMSLRHKTFKIWGVQFHPESIMTNEGYQMIDNFLKI